MEMRIEIIDRPSKSPSLNDPFVRIEPSYSILIYPETNAEMAQLERPLVIGFTAIGYRRISDNTLRYAIAFGKPA